MASHASLVLRSSLVGLIVVVLVSWIMFLPIPPSSRVFAVSPACAFLLRITLSSTFIVASPLFLCPHSCHLIILLLLLTCPFSSISLMGTASSSPFIFPDSSALQGSLTRSRRRPCLTYSRRLFLSLPPFPSHTALPCSFAASVVILVP